jgi:hypothetical protein
MTYLAVRCCAAGATYGSLVSANHTNGFKIKVEASNTGEPPVQLCKKEAVVGGSCKAPEISWDKKGSVKVSFKLPAPTDSTLFLKGLKPDKYRVFLCFSDPDQVLRKWRKFNDLFKVLQSSSFWQYCSPSQCACAMISGIGLNSIITLILSAHFLVWSRPW